MRQQRNQDSTSIYRPKDSPTKTPDGSTTTSPLPPPPKQQQQHVQFANPECVTNNFKASPIHRNLSSPSALHSPKSITQSAQSTNGYSPSKVDSGASNGLKRTSSNQSYHSVDSASSAVSSSSTYESMPKASEYTNPTKDYGSYVKPSSPLKSAGSLANDTKIVPIVLSPTANCVKSKSSTTTTTKVTRYV